MAPGHRTPYPSPVDQPPTIEANEAVEEILALALGGRSVIVTRQGLPVAELRPLVTPAIPDDLPSGPADIAWLRRHRVGRLEPGMPDAGEFVRRMRDEDGR